MVGQHLISELDAHLVRRRLRHLVGIDSVEILARGIRVRVANRLATAAPGDEAAVQSMHEVVEFARA